MLKMLDLFSGIGGFSLAAHWTGGIETVAFCEIEPYCQKVLHKHWPNVPIFNDIYTVRGCDIEPIDIICGGFPCQPYSIAGRKRGKEDNRDLWPQMFRVIQEKKPAWVVGENVANFANMELERTLSDLESEGYEVQTFNIPACAVNAPHERKRIWIVGHAERCGCSRESWGWSGQESKNGHIQLETPNVANTTGEGLRKREKSEQHNTILPIEYRGCQSGEQWDIEPNVGRVAHGIPHRVDRIKALGNSIVPQVVYPIFMAILEIEKSA